MTVLRESQLEDSDEQRFFSVRVDRDLHERIVRLAERNDRAVSAEIRIALRQYAELSEKAA